MNYEDNEMVKETEKQQKRRWWLYLIITLVFIVIALRWVWAILTTAGF